MVQGKKCLAVHSTLPPIVFVFLPERIGGEKEHAAEEKVQQSKRDVHGNETVNHADDKNDAEDQAKIKVTHTNTSYISVCDLFPCLQYKHIPKEARLRECPRMVGF